MTAVRPTTWQGHSLAALEANTAVREDLIVKLQEAQASLQARISEAERRMKEELGRMLDINPGEVRMSGWRCDASPTGTCVYDTGQEYPLDDHCVVCDESDERG